jgi:hypothetical protein
MNASNSSSGEEDEERLIGGAGKNPFISRKVSAYNSDEEEGYGGNLKRPLLLTKNKDSSKVTKSKNVNNDAEESKGGAAR